MHDADEENIKNIVPEDVRTIPRGHWKNKIKVDNTRGTGRIQRVRIAGFCEHWK